MDDFNERKNTLSNLLECIKVEANFTFKSVWFYLLMITWTIILLFQTLIIMPQNIEIGTSLTLSAFWVQLLIFLGIFIGFYLAKRESFNYCDELMISIRNGYFFKQISKVVIIFILGTIIFATSTLFIITYFVLNKIDLIYYVPSIKYLFLYWYLGFIISGALGIIIGNIFSSKVVYFLMVFIGLLIGPICMDIIDPLLDVLPIMLHPYFMAFNLGQLDPHKGMNSVFGYELQNQLWIIRLILVICLIVIFIMLFYRYENKKNKKRFHVFGIIFVITMLIVNYGLSYDYVKMNYFRYLMDDITENYDVSEDIREYENNFNILSSNIEINSKKNLEIYTDMNIKPMKSTDKLSLVLYRGFNVKNIKINDVDVEFSRQGDNIYISNKFINNEDFNIKIHYNGLPLNYLHQDKDAWILTANFSWLPFVGDYNSVTRNSDVIYDFTFNYEKQDTLIDYNIKYYGAGNPICSLNKVEENHWSGQSYIGATLINGWLKESTTKDNIKFYYPISYKNYDKYVPMMINQCEKFRNVINKDFNITSNSFTNNEKSYIFLPRYFPSNTEIKNLDNHNIVYIHEGYIDGEGLIDYFDNLKWVLQNTVLDNNWKNPQKDVKDDFIDSYITWYKKRFESNNESLRNRLLHMVNISERYDNKESTLRYTRLNDFIMNSDDNKIKEFLNKWLEMSKNTDDIQWSHIENLMN